MEACVELGPVRPVWEGDSLARLGGRGMAPQEHRANLRLQRGRFWEMPAEAGPRALGPGSYGHKVERILRLGCLPLVSLSPRGTQEQVSDLAFSRMCLAGAGGGGSPKAPRLIALHRAPSAHSVAFFPYIAATGNALSRPTEAGSLLSAPGFILNKKCGRSPELGRAGTRPA